MSLPENTNPVAWHYPLAVLKLREVDRRGKVQCIARDLNSPMGCWNLTLGQNLTFLGHKMVKIWPTEKISCNSRTIRPRTTPKVSKCLSWAKDFDDMRHDLARSHCDLDLAWPKVKVKCLYTFQGHVAYHSNPCGMLVTMTPNSVLCLAPFMSYSQQLFF